MIALGGESVPAYTPLAARSDLREKNRMFVRLTRANRSKAGRLLVLVYLVCVLAPSISFAFSDRSRAAPYPADEKHGLGVVRVHELSKNPAQHAQKDGHKYEHSVIHAHFGEPDSKDKDIRYVEDETPAPARGSDKASGTQCCGMVSLSALPSTAIGIVKPTAPTSICASENYQNVVDNVPPRLYRPPIA
ncbi:MAG: hypothetical protein ABIL01_25980 [Pseudomonadota bacterium]